MARGGGHLADKLRQSALLRYERQPLDPGTENAFRCPSLTSCCHMTHLLLTVREMANQYGHRSLNRSARSYLAVNSDGDKPSMNTRCLHVSLGLEFASMCNALQVSSPSIDELPTRLMRHCLANEMRLSARP